MDGGANWSDENEKTPAQGAKNTSIDNASECLIFCMSGKLIVGKDAIIQNCANGVISTSDHAEVTIQTGAEIRNNDAGEYAFIWANNGSALTIEGGTFSGNRVGTLGIIRIDTEPPSSATITGGTFEGNFSTAENGVVTGIEGMSISGAPVFQANHWGKNYENPKTSNIFIPTGKKLNIAGELTDSAYLSVNTETAPTEETPVVIAEGSGVYDVTEPDAEKFHSDDDRYETGFDETHKTVVLKLKSSSSTETMPEMNGDVIYANGVALILDAGVDQNGVSTPDKTVIWLDHNRDGKIDNPGDTIWDPDGDGSYNDTGEGNDLSQKAILGGSNGTSLTGDTMITMLGGKVKHIYGGSESAFLTGNTKITIKAGSVSMCYGGGFGGSNDADISGGTNIEIDGGSIGSIYGGGDASYKASRVSGNTTVTVTGGTVTEIHGGGSSDGSDALVRGTSSVILSGNARADSIYGGGYCTGSGKANVTKAVVAIQDTASAGEVYLGGLAKSGGSLPSIGAGSTLTVGGHVTVGNGREDIGIVLNGGTDSIANGTVSFAIDPDLAGTVYVAVPKGFNVSESSAIATGAAAGDVNHIKLNGEGAEGLAAYYENGSITVRQAGSIPTVTGVTVTPNQASVQKGSTQQFSASVSGTGSPAQTVTWTVSGAGTSGTGASGAISAGTTISADGLLTVAADETSSALNVQAASTADPAKTGTATVLVTDVPVTQYTLTVTGGSGSGSYEAGSQIRITADAPAAGRQFKDWSSSGITLADAAANPLTITMPANDVALTANWTSTGGNNQGGGGGNSGGSGGGSDGGSGSTNSTTGSTAGSGNTTATPPTTTTAGDGSTVSTSTVTNSSTGATATTEVKKDAAGGVASAEVTVQTAGVSVTAGETETKALLKVDASLVDAAAQEARNQGASGLPVDVKIELPAQTLAEQLNTPDGKPLHVEVEIPAALSVSTSAPVTEIRLPKEAMEAAKSSGKDVTVTVRDEHGNVSSEWSFDGEDLKNSGRPAADVNLALTVTPVKNLSAGQEAVKNQVAQSAGISGGEVPGLYLDFAGSGALPAKAKIRIPAGGSADLKPGSPVYLYYLNPATGQAEALPDNQYEVGADGYITIYLDHNSQYVLTPKRIETAPPAQYAGRTTGASRTYVIQKGDTLFKLAKACGCTVQDILAMNHIPDVNDLRIGQEIELPAR